MGGERIERDPDRSCCSAYGGPGRRVVIFEPTYLLHSRLRWLAHTEVVSAHGSPTIRARRRQVERRATRPSPTWCSSARRTTPPATRSRWRWSRALAERRRRAGRRRRGVHRVRRRERAAARRRRTRTWSSCARSPRRSRWPARGSGTCSTSPDVVDDLQRVRLPYHVSALTQAAGIAALRHRAEALRDPRRASARSAIASSTALERDPGRDGVPVRRELRPVRAAAATPARSGRDCSTAACSCAT